MSQFQGRVKMLAPVNAVCVFLNTAESIALHYVTGRDRTVVVLRLSTTNTALTERNDPASPLSDSM